MSSLSIFYNRFFRPGQHCSVNKIIPGTKIETFTVRHYYQQKHVSWIPVHTADQKVRKGKHYINDGMLGVPDCWKDINATSDIRGQIRRQRKRRNLR